MDVSWMYAKRRVKEEEEPPKERIVFWVVVAVVVVVVMGSSWFTYSYLKDKILPTDLTKDCERTFESRVEGNLLVVLCIKKDGNLFLIWKNLPNETTSINIYRTDEEGGGPKLWKTVTVTGGEGSLDIGSGSDTEGYAIGFEVTDASGNVEWTSPNTPSSPSGNTPGSGTGNSPTGSGQGQAEPPSNQPPATSNPSPPPASTSSQTSTPPPPSPPPPTPTSTPQYDTSTYVYYTPSGEVSGTSSIPTASFWAKHVNKIIEIGWQNIASTTNKIIIYRSQTETGGYDQLFIQQNPVVEGSDFIRLDDHTINESYYYKMEARNGSTVLATYGPVFLPALGQ